MVGRVLFMENFKDIKRDNQKPSLKESQTIPWLKEKEQKAKQ